MHDTTRARANVMRHFHWERVKDGRPGADAEVFARGPPQIGLSKLELHISATPTDPPVAAPAMQSVVVAETCVVSELT